MILRAVLILPTLMLAAAPPDALAAPRAGGLAVVPATGTDQSVVEVETTGPCPAGENLQVTIYGRGFPASGQRVVSNSALTAYERTASGGYSVPLAMTLRDFANLQANPVPLSGRYTLALICRNKVKVGALAEFVGGLTFSTPRAYSAAAPIAPTKPFAPIAGSPSTSRAVAGEVDPGGAGPGAPAMSGAAAEVAEVAEADTGSGRAPDSGSIVLLLAGVVAVSGVATGVAARLRPRRRVDGTAS